MELNKENVEGFLDREVRPELARHGGNIRVETLEGDILRLRLLGQCSGCPSAELTMEQLVRKTLTEAFPQLREVALVTGVSDALIDEARRMLRARHS